MGIAGFRACLAGLPAIALALLFPASALAHTSERAFILLLPTGYYMTAAGIAVGATFLLLAFMPKGISDRLADARLGLFSVRPPTSTPTSVIAFLFLAIIVAAGFFGSRDPLENPLPLTIWTLWWIVFTLVTAIVGDLWIYLNPWSGPARLALKAFGRRRSRPLVAYPAQFAYLPAIVQFLAFALFEQVDIAPADPERLALAVGLYWLVNFVAVLVFGEDDWFRYGEPFSIFFRFISRLSPLVWEVDSGAPGKWRLSLAMPGAALLGRPALPLTGTLFVLLTLTLESFDGLSETFWWMGIAGINPLEFPGRSAVVWINTFGLLAGWAALTGVYVGAVVLGWLLAGRPGRLVELLGALVFSLMPIALAFHFSHYLTAVLVNGQYALAAASDPFGTGLNLLTPDGFEVTTSFLNTHEGTKAIWDSQTAGIIIGHVLGILLAHEIACRLIGDYRAAVISQAPLAVIMVVYTLFGLWLLSSPVVG